MCLIFLWHIRVRTTHHTSVVWFCELNLHAVCLNIMLEQNKLLSCFLEPCCVFHIFGYIQNLLRYFFFVFSLFCPAASSFFLWCSLCGYMQSFTKKSLQIQRTRQPCCCFYMDVWALTLCLHSHHVTFFSHGTGCFIHPSASEWFMLKRNRFWSLDPAEVHRVVPFLPAYRERDCRGIGQ